MSKQLREVQSVAQGHIWCRTRIQIQSCITLTCSIFFLFDYLILSLVLACSHHVSTCPPSVWVPFPEAQGEVVMLCSMTLDLEFTHKSTASLLLTLL